MKTDKSGQQYVIVPSVEIFDRCYFATAMPAEGNASLIAIDICPGSITSYDSRFQEVYGSVGLDVSKITVRIKAADHATVYVRGRVRIFLNLFES